MQTGAGKDPGTKWATIRQTSEAISFSVAPICYPTEGPIPSRADIHDLAQPFDGNMSVFFAHLGRFVPRFACRAMDESEPHLLRSAKNWVAFFCHVPLLPKHAVFFPQLGDVALKIRLDGWLLGSAMILLDPAVQRLEDDTEIGCHLLARQAAG